MRYWLARPGDAMTTGFVKRFDPRFWTVDFPRPMMASVTTTGPRSLRVDTVFYKANDLAGLIWEAEDRFDHPLLAYETSRDFRGLTLSFRWQSSGLMALDAVDGPTLTIEGRASDGAARTWYVRLWNYATGTPTDAQVALDFDQLAGGFALPGDADPVWAGDIDRMFLSLVPPGYTNTDALLTAPVEAYAELDDIACEGGGAVLTIGDTIVQPHGLSIATGYDDCYNQTPARVLRNIFQLGYRACLNHYVGMSHFFRLGEDGGALRVRTDGDPLNRPAGAWHQSFAVAARGLGYELIVSLSYEVFDAHCPDDWKQRAWNGDPALTGYTPPSALLSPANDDAMAYLSTVARSFVDITVDAGHAPRFQVGEPWWWVLPDGRPCLYDDAARAAFGGSPVEIATVRSTALNAAQKSLLDAAGAILAASTAALIDAVRGDHPACEALLLVYLPTAFDPAAPDLRRANVPLTWAAPAFDTLQIEDYDWVTAGNVAASAAATAALQARLGYGLSRQHYFAGFVATASAREQWRLIEDATQRAMARGVAQTFIWAHPQVVRDGFTAFTLEEEPMQAFDDIQFPLAIGAGASVIPGFSTAIVTSAAGYEQRNMDWASGRLRFDAGPGVRSEADLQNLIAFFRARRGAAKGFRFADPLDHSSNGMTGVPTAADQVLGEGNGIRTVFPLIKRYGLGEEAEVRRITRPDATTLLVAIDGAATASFTLETGGMIAFAAAPPVGSTVSAGFRFDVPVRFAEDSLAVDAATWAAGEAPSVPLIEIREA